MDGSVHWLETDTTREMFRSGGDFRSCNRSKKLLPLQDIGPKVVKEESVNFYGEVVYSSLARANRIPSENLMLYQCYFRDKVAPALSSLLGSQNS